MILQHTALYNSTMSWTLLPRKKRIMYVVLWLLCSFSAFLILQELPLAATGRKTLEKQATTTAAPTKRPKHTSTLLEVLAAASKMDTTEVPVLMTFLTNGSLAFANNWLCNIADYGLYPNLVLLTSSDFVKKELTRKWPVVHVISVESEMSGYRGREKDLRCSKFLGKAVSAVLEANLQVLLFRVDSVWLQDPINLLQSIITNRKNVNMVIAGFSKRSSDLDIGFTLLKADPEVIMLWNQYLVMIDGMLKRLAQSGIHTVHKSENERNYFSQLVRQRFGRVKHHLLTADLVADDRWYGAPLFRIEDTQFNFQSKLHVVRNYWADVENLPRKKIMKNARHWFIEEASDWACDMDKVFQAEKSVWRI